MQPKTKLVIGVSAGVIILALLVWAILATSSTPARKKTGLAVSTLDTMPQVGPLELEEEWVTVTPSSTNTTTHKRTRSPEEGQYQRRDKELGDKGDHQWYWWQRSKVSPPVAPTAPLHPITQVVTNLVERYFTNTVTLPAPPTTNYVVYVGGPTSPPVVINVAAGAQASATATNGGTTNVVVTPPPPQPGLGEPYWLRKLPGF